MKPRPDITLTSGWRFPAAAVSRLGNGLEVWAYHLPGQHVVSAALVVDLPLTAEPADREGVATICVRGLDEGSLAHPGPEFAARLEDLGAEYSGWATTAASIGLVEAPAPWFAAALALLAEAASAPQFAPAEVARLTAQRLAELGQLRTSAGRLANWLLRSTVLDPAHRSARLSGGGRASVAAIQAADVQAFHARCYGPGAATLIVAGDLPASAVQEAAEAAFGSWEHSVIPTSHEPAWPAARRRRLIHRPGAVQADIRLGTWGPDRRDPLWPAFQVASVIMGGGFASRLNQALREERGWTYDVSVTPHALRQGGWICLATSTQTATAVPLIEESLGLLALEAGGFSEAERRDAVGFLTGVAPLSFSTADAVTGHGAGLASHGLDPQTAEAELEALAQVTAAEAEAAWRTFIDPDQMSLVVLGDGDQLAGPLALTPEPLPQL